MASIGAAFDPLIYVVGFAVGNAVGPVLQPFLQDERNFVWAQHRVRPLDVRTAAEMAVEGVWTLDRARTEASYTGFSDGRLDALAQLIDDPPDVQSLMALWRRGLISAAKFQEGLRHHRVESEYFEPLAATHDVLLTPEQLAAARVKGHIDQGRQYSEAALWGVTNERAQIMYETTGNPPGPETLITMLNRGIITEAEFAQGIKQGNIRPEYVDEYLALRHHLLTPTEIVNLRLRGWIDDAEMYAKGAQLGYDTDHMHDLFLGQGRPITARQVFIGLRRGGTYNGPTGAIPQPVLKSLQEGNLRPEWYNLAHAQIESYPSAFVIRRLAQDGDITPAQTRTVLMHIGWPEWLVDAVVTSWTGGTAGTTTGPRTKAAQTAAITQIRNAYTQRRADDGQVRGWLAQIGVAPEDIDGMVNVWNVMLEVPGAGLTRSQIRKAYRDSIYSRDVALAELEALGMEPDEAAVLLDE